MLFDQIRFYYFNKYELKRRRDSERERDREREELQILQFKKQPIRVLFLQSKYLDLVAFGVCREIIRKTKTSNFSQLVFSAYISCTIPSAIYIYYSNNDNIFFLRLADGYLIAVLGS